MTELEPATKVEVESDLRAEKARSKRAWLIMVPPAIVGALVMWGMKETNDAQPKAAVLPHTALASEMVVDCSALESFKPTDEDDKEILAGEQPVFPFSSLPATSGTDTALDVVRAYQNHQSALAAEACNQYGQTHGGISPHRMYEIHPEVETVPENQPNGFRFLVSIIGEA